MEPNPPDARGDDVLVEATGRGDRAAFRILVDRWAPRVRSFLQRALDSRRDAEDLTQETFLRVYRAAPRYRAEGHFAAWLFRIAGNLARAQLRRRRVVALVLGEPLPQSDDALAALPAPRAADPDSLVQADEIRRAVASALSQLPVRQRLAVLLRYYEELSTAEIARALGTSPHAAESLLARGTRELRRILRVRLPP